jgi:hippurate hydrolase
MAMVLGAAAVLSANGRFDGTVRVIFQPAEEPGRGAQAMLDDGLLDAFPIDALYGLHNLPGIPAGHLHTPPGAIMANEDNFEIVVTGRGGHAARPHLVVDPLVVEAEIVLALQTVVASTVNPVQPAVLSCTEFHIDGAHNASPDRSASLETPAASTPMSRNCSSDAYATPHRGRSRRNLHRRIHARVRPKHQRREPYSRRGSGGGSGPECGPRRRGLRPDHASEDFGIFARHVPACFALIGNGTAEGHGGTALHSRTYDANDDILEAGVSYYLEVIRSELPTR